MTDNGNSASKLVEFLKKWQTCSGNRKHDLHAVVFDNKYTKDELSWHRLKSVDKKLALAIKSAAVVVKMEIYLASFTCYKSSYTSRCGFDNLDLCDGEKRHSFSNFFNLAGSSWEMQQNTSKVNRLAMACDSDDKAGTKERWEHRMALVLWPSANIDTVMKRTEVSVSIVYSREWAQQFGEFDLDMPKECCGRAFVASISRLEMESGKIPISFIFLDSQKKFGKPNFDSKAGIQIVSAFQLTNNGHLFTLFVNEILTPLQICDISADLFKLLMDCAVQFGSDLCLPLIKKLAENKKSFHTAVMLLKELCTSENKDSACFKDAIAILAPQVLANLETAEDQRKQAQESQFLSSQTASPYDFKVNATATSLLCIYSVLNISDGLERVIRYFHRASMRHPVSTVILHVLYHWGAWLDKMTNSEPGTSSTLQFAFEQKTRLVEDCIQQLNESLQFKVSQNGIGIMELPCKCKDCNILQDFLQDPEQNVLVIAIEQLCQPKIHLATSVTGFPDLCMTINSQCITLVKKKKVSYKRQMKSCLQSRATVVKLRKLLPPDHPLNLKEQIETSPPLSPLNKRPKIESLSHPQEN